MSRMYVSLHNVTSITAGEVHKQGSGTFVRDLIIHTESGDVELTLFATHRVGVDVLNVGPDLSDHMAGGRNRARAEA